MSTKLKIKEALELKPGSTYVLRFNYNPNREELAQIKTQFDKLFDTLQIRFIVLTKELEFLYPTSLIETPDVTELITKLFTKSLDDWQKNLPRIITP